MQIGILGYGKEGKSAEQYFQKRGAKVEIIDDFDPKDLNGRDFNDFDLILRSPSVPPQQNFSSMTKYFLIIVHARLLASLAQKAKALLAP